MTEGSEEYKRQDVDAYCPRIDKKILILSGRCFYPGRSLNCQGCVFDIDFVFVKLTLLLAEILQEKVIEND